MNPAQPVILITGAARRVGAEIARALHATGARLLLHFHSSATAAASLAAELNSSRPGTVACAAGDLRDAGQLSGLVATAVQEFGGLDGLVNNASSFYATPVGSIDERVWQDLMGSNLKGPLFLSQAAAPYLRETRGAIVNLTDIHAEFPLKNYPLYCVAKAGLLALTRALALELAPEVRVNAVAPGPIAWPEGSAAADFDPAARAAIIRRTPMQHQGAPADIARTVRFLLFDAPYVTGQVINVDGGRSISL